MLIGQAAVEKLDALDRFEIRQSFQRRIGKPGVGESQFAQGFPRRQTLQLTGRDLAVSERKATQPTARLEVLHGLIIEHIRQAQAAELRQSRERGEVAG